VETDVYGNRFMTEVIPAYRKYSALGLKLSDGANKNMLTQTSAIYMYKVDGSNTKLGLVSAQVQTWSNGATALDKDGTAYTQNGGAPGVVWRMQSSYSWLPDTKTADGMTAIGSFSDFNFTTPSSSDAAWKETSEITLYDVYSHGLEAKDMYNNYAATRMDYGNKKVILSGGPANYYEMAYSGAEDAAIDNNIEGFVWKNEGTVVAGPNHTGTNALYVSSIGFAGTTKTGFTYTISTNKLTAGRDYMASVWVKPVTIGSFTPTQQLLYQINGVTKASVGRGTKQSNGWYLLLLKINGSDISAGNTLTIKCTNTGVSLAFNTYMDDFRFQPFNSATTAYIYNNFSGELTHILDNNNQYTKFEYDVSGKLIRTFRETLTNGVFKTSEFVYNYGAAVQFQSDAISNNYTSQTPCPTGQTPVPYYVYVPQGMFTSLVSVADANTSAQEYAQQQANQYGTCQVTVDLQYYNSSSGCYQVDLYNVNTGEEWWIDVPAGSGTLGYVPPGTYDISIYMPYYCDYGNCRTFSTGNSSTNYNCNNGAYFTGVTINQTYKSISIY
jgi:YD repeat-containing protein